MRIHNYVRLGCFVAFAMCMKIALTDHALTMPAIVLAALVALFGSLVEASR